MFHCCAGGPSQVMVTCALSHAATLCAHPVLACKSIQHHAPVLSPCKCRAQGAMSWRQRNQNSSNRLCPAWHVFMQTRPNYPTCPWIGWASLFMQHINATWPHAHHTLLNLGMGGAMLSGYVIGGCILSRLPAHVDLVMMENLGAGSPPHYLEQVGSVYHLFKRMHLARMCSWVHFYSCTAWYFKR